MFAPRQQGTVIAKGLKIVGSVTAEGLVEVNGQIDGELHCTSLVIARGAHVNRRSRARGCRWNSRRSDSRRRGHS
jgi:cytoskeletal protein CcmA (bactofilin family)